MTGRIIGLGSYIPKKVVTNDDFAKFLDTSDEWITERTGIKERHIADHITEKPSTMAVEAAKKAIEDAGIDPKDIDLIVTACTTPDLVIPSMSCVVHEAIGASENCGCFDVNSACPGFVAAFNTVQSFIESGNSKVALCIGSECNSNFANYEDRGTCILFGDGAGAAVLKADDNAKRNEFIMRSSGARGGCLHCEAARQPDRWEEEGFKTASRQPHPSICRAGKYSSLQYLRSPRSSRIFQRSTASISIRMLITTFFTRRMRGSSKPRQRSSASREADSP